MEFGNPPITRNAILYDEKRYNNNYNGSVVLTVSSACFSIVGIILLFMSKMQPTRSDRNLSAEGLILIMIGVTSIVYHRPHQNKFKLFDQKIALLIDTVTVHIGGGYILLSNLSDPIVVSFCFVMLLASAAKPEALELERTGRSFGAIVYHLIAIHMPALTAATRLLFY